MKKLFVAFALFLGLGTSAVMAGNVENTTVETVTALDEFKTIDLKDLPQSVKDAIAKKYPGSTLKEASVEIKEDGTKSYRVVYTDKEGKEDSILINVKTEPEKQPGA